MKKPLLAVAVVITLFVLVLSAFAFKAVFKLYNLSNASVQQDEPKAKPSNTVQKPNLISTKKAQVVLFEDNLYLFDLATKKLENPQIKTLFGGGEQHQGETRPLTSPNLFYTAYITKDSQKLVILAHENLQKYEVDINCEVQYITDWLKDSKRVIFKCKDHSIDSARDGLMAWEGVETFDPNQKTGFYMFNIESGENTSLYPVKSVITAIDASRLLVPAQYNTGRMVVFNVDTFTADYDLIKETFEFGDNQFSTSQDGNYWAFHEGSSETETPVTMMYAPLGQETGTAIESGAWAYVQWPKISPNGQFVVYQKRTGVNDKGHETNDLILYNTSNKTKQKIAEGNNPQWVENQGILFSKSYTDPVQQAFYDLQENQEYPIVLN